MLPRGARRHLLALYGFLRLTDELGDAFPGDRLAALAELEADLARAFEGRARHPVLRQLAPTLRDRALSREPFARLIEANRRDQHIHRHASYAALLESCAYSANPVGELVLEVFGVSSPARRALSDRVCSALQIAEHCQDVGEDYASGRIYLPGDELAACGCPEADLAGAAASPALREVLRRVAGRARGLLHEGEPLLGELGGAARLAVTGFVAGGHAALGGIEHIGFDVLGTAPARAPARSAAPLRSPPRAARARRVSAPHVAVVGGGLAGLSAAIACQDAGARVTLLEARARLGGATWSARLHGLTVDNGQHVFLRCCSAYRAFLERLGVGDRVHLQRRLAVPVLTPGGRTSWIRRAPLPAPAHLAPSLLRFAPLRMAERLRAARSVRRLGALDLEDRALDGISLGEWLRANGESEHAIDGFWELLIRPILNLSARDASLALAAMFFQTGLLREADGADLGYANVPLQALHAEPAEAILRRGGGEVRVRSRVTELEPASAARGPTLRVAGERIEADAVIVAVPHEDAAALLPGGRQARPERPRGARQLADPEPARRLRPAGHAAPVLRRRRLAAPVGVRPLARGGRPARPVPRGVALRGGRVRGSRARCAARALPARVRRAAARGARRAARRLLRDARAGRHLPPGAGNARAAPRTRRRLAGPLPRGRVDRHRLARHDGRRGAERPRRRPRRARRLPPASALPLPPARGAPHAARADLRFRRTRRASRSSARARRCSRARRAPATGRPSSRPTSRWTPRT